MASAAQTPTQDMQPLLSQRRFLGWALLWGAIVLGIMALWLYTKYIDAPALLVWGFVVLAVASLGLAIWLLRSPAKPQEASLQNQRHIVGMALGAGGVVLGIAAVWLGFGWGLVALGESLGLGILALIAVGASARLLSRPQATSVQERVLQGLIERRLGASTALQVVGVIVAIFGLWLRFWSREVTAERPPVDLPLWLGPILIGLLCISIGAYLRFTPDLTVERARLFVLIFGGGLGLLIALFTAWQAWNWRNVFFGGLPAWRGPQAWQLWLCAYLELAGLILMFACLGLARADIRVNPVLRRALYGYNAVLTGLLLLVFLIVLNIVVYVAFPFTFNWSESGGLYALSPKSIDILENLEKPTKVYLVMSRQSGLIEEVRHLLNNAQAVTNQLDFEQVNPDRDPERYLELAKKYPELKTDPFVPGSGRGVLLVYNEGGAKPEHRFLSQDKLTEANPIKRTQSFVGEKVIMQELQYFMTEKRKSTVYVLQGNGEMSLKGRGFFRLEPNRSMSELGLSRLVDRLRKENFEIKGLSFAPPPAKPDDQIVHLPEPVEGKRKEIPEDAGVVVIPGPGIALGKDTLEALERYLEGKGRLICLMEVVTDRAYKEMISTGLEDFLKKYGVEVTNQYVHSFGFVGRDRKGQRAVEYDTAPTQVYATPAEEGHSQLAKKFAGEAFLLTTARVVKPSSGPPGKYQVQTLLEVSPRLGVGGRPVQFNIWGEDVSALRDPQRHNRDIPIDVVDRKRSPEAIPVAVTVHEGTDKPRMIVMGDAEFISDRYLIQPPGEIPPDVYYSFFASMIDWLTERPGLGIRPREPGIYVMKTEVLRETGRLVLTPGLMMLLGVCGLGVGIWVVRRR